MPNIFYCKECVFPSTRPHLTFNKKGICSACFGSLKKKLVDWDYREKEFSLQVALVKQIKAKYDCVIPVSGGKDSIYQVVKVKQYGLNVLAVNVDYGIKTDEGIHNLNIIADKLGTDILTFKPGNYHKQLIKLGFLEYGDPDLFSHALLYSYPVYIAKNLDIPIIFFGENPATEYIGKNKDRVDLDWFYTYVIDNKCVNNFIWLKSTYYKLNDIDRYFIEDHMFDRIHFIGDYFYWDSHKHAAIADSLGFKRPQQVPGTYRNWVGIDEVIHRIHQYMKVIKFGYGRATDHACEDVREGKITRQEAIKLASYDETGLPNSIILQFCSYIDISTEQFESTIDKFRNKDFWVYNNSRWYLNRNFDSFKE